MKFVKIFFSALWLFLKRVGRAIRFPLEHSISMRSRLRVEIFRAPGRKLTFKETLMEWRNLLLRWDRYDYGIVGRNMVTTHGVAYIGAGITSGSLTNGLVYHQWGTDGRAENSVVDNQGCYTPAPPTDGTNPLGVGTRSGAMVGNNYVYSSVCTLVATVAAAIVEHAICWTDNDPGFDGQAFDRTQFGAYNLQIGDSIRFTYELTLQSGS